MKKRKQKKKRIRKPKFTIRSNKENNQWKLGGEKAKIIGWHVRHYVPEAELRRDITDQNPAPTDLTIVPDTDPQIRSVLETRKRDIILSKDAALALTQSRIKDALGPFPRGWKRVEDKKTNKYLEMSALLLGQSILHLSHQRR